MATADPTASRARGDGLPATARRTSTPSPPSKGRDGHLGEEMTAPPILLGFLWDKSRDFCGVFGEQAEGTAGGPPTLAAPRAPVDDNVVEAGAGGSDVGEVEQVRG
jgi:hypothetical protein